MSKITFFFLLGAILSGLCFTACDDDKVKFNDVEVKNTELKAILLKQGFTFNNAGQLVLDEKALNTKMLDLSGTKISDLSGLDVLPNLTEVNLSGNGYGPVFDFSPLPAQVTAIDLTGNKIFDFDKLIEVEIEENGDEAVTNLRNITKLYLPESAKSNIEVLMRFYRENKTEIENGTIDLKMEDDNGTLQKYTTLRSIPDDDLRTYLQETFSDMFSGDQIDISKRFGNAQKTIGISIGEYFSLKSVNRLEGIQYIINHPYWEGNIYILMKEKLVLPYLNIGKYTSFLALENLDATEGIEISDTEALFFIYMSGIDGIENIDISASPIWGQRESSIEGDPFTGSTFKVIDCPSLKEIKLPAKDKLYAWEIDIECLPALESIDLSNIQMLFSISMGDLPTQCKISYPNLTANHFYVGDIRATSFICSESTYNRPETISFIDKYYDIEGKKPKSPGITPTFTGLNCPKNTAFEWAEQ